MCETRGPAHSVCTSASLAFHTEQHHRSRFMGTESATLRRRTNCGEASGNVTMTEAFARRSRSDAFADRLEHGALALAAFAEKLTAAEWEARVPHDGRKVGVVVHHVASMYPLEIQLAQTLAR